MITRARRCRRSWVVVGLSAQRKREPTSSTRGRSAPRASCRGMKGCVFIAARRRLRRRKLSRSLAPLLGERREPYPDGFRKNATQRHALRPPSEVACARNSTQRWVGPALMESVEDYRLGYHTLALVFCTRSSAVWYHTYLAHAMCRSCLAKCLRSSKVYYLPASQRRVLSEGLRCCCDVVKESLLRGISHRFQLTLILFLCSFHQLYIFLLKTSDKRK